MSLSVTAAARSFTAALCIRVDVSLASMSFLLASSCCLACSEALPPASSAIVASSSIFWYANANQRLISAGSFCSFFSCAKSYGTCRKEDDPATHTRSLPNFSTALSMIASDCWKLFFQMLRPSTTPSDRILSDGSCANTSSICCGARTRSMCRASTGRLTARLVFSCSPLKYVASTIFKLVCLRISVYTLLYIAFTLSSMSSPRNGSSICIHSAPAASKVFSCSMNTGSRRSMRSIREKPSSFSLPRSR